jgi:hypothetical protein
VLSVNNNKIQRGDPLMVKTVVINRSADSVVLPRKTPRDGSQCHATYELRTANGWRSVIGMHHKEDCSVSLPMRGSVPTPGPVLESKASYAEFETLFFQRDGFVFDTAKTYHLRAVVETSEGPIVSRPVRIVVGERSDGDVKRIIQARKRRALALLGTDWLSSDLYEELKSHKNMDGNIGRSIRNLIVLEDIISGRKEIGNENATEFLKRHMTGVDWELGLLVLGTHYRQKNDVKRLAEVVNAMAHSTYQSNEWVSYLEFLTPPRFVPGTNDTKQDRGQ